MATILDVANEAGVSTATVSRVLNDSRLVSSEKRKLVMAAVQKTGYQIPERTIRSNNSSKKLILMIGSLYHPPICNNFQKEAIGLGYQVVFAYFDKPNQLNELRETIQLLRDQLAGILLLNTPDDSPELQNLLNDYPLVQVGSAIYTDRPYFSVGSDEIAISRAATDTLISQGCRKIGILSVDLKTSIVIARKNDRVNGCILSMLNHGLSPDPDMIRYVDSTFEGGYDGAQALLSAHPDIDGIVCTLDSIAIGCDSYLSQAGLRKNIRMIASDSSESYDLHKQNISCVNNQQDVIGMSAARILHAVISGELNSSFHQIIPFYVEV